MPRKSHGIGPYGGGSLSASIAASTRIPNRSNVRPPSSSSSRPAPLRPSTSATRPTSSNATYPAAKRGSMSLALQAAATDESLTSAIDDFIRDRYAPNSNRVRATWLKTWLKMHAAAFASRPDVPAFPLTPSKITRVAALFKAGGYLSYENYVLRAKSEHLSLGLTGAHAWSIELTAALNDSVRSCGRGTGAVSYTHLTLPTKRIV